MTEKTKLDIVRELDAVECELFSLYRRIEGLRMALQAQWRVTPDQIKAAPRA